MKIHFLGDFVLYHNPPVNTVKLGYTPVKYYVLGYLTNCVFGDYGVIQVRSEKGRGKERGVPTHLIGNSEHFHAACVTAEVLTAWCAAKKLK